MRFWDGAVAEAEVAIKEIILITIANRMTIGVDGAVAEVEIVGVEEAVGIKITGHRITRTTTGEEGLDTTAWLRDGFEGG